MKGYIYRLYPGADPSKGWIFNDPIFGAPPTLGACVPNLRRSVDVGDWVFCISGTIKTHQPYVVGGFRVQEKIDALEAYRRYPQYRLDKADNGQVIGNVIVDKNGKRSPIDNHDGFEKRLENYLVGSDPLYVSAPDNIERARQETLPTLQKIFNKAGNRSFDIVPRWRKMDESQIDKLRTWLVPLSE